MDASIGAWAGALAAVLAALGGVVKLVLDALAKQDERHNAAIERMAERQEKFLGNHMSKNTAALEAVANRLEGVERAVRNGRS